MMHEAWITIRLKGVMGVSDDPHRVGERVQAQADSLFSHPNPHHSFMITQPGDVIEVAVEDQIYGEDND